MCQPLLPLSGARRSAEIAKQLDVCNELGGLDVVLTLLLLELVDALGKHTPGCSRISSAVAMKVQDTCRALVRIKGSVGKPTQGAGAS